MATRPLGRSFWALIVAQFFGAFNDNFFKQCLLFAVIDGSSPLFGASKGFDSRVQVAIGATVLFTLPFILFSPLAGTIADRFGKRRVTVWMKTAEVALMLAGAVGFATGSVPFLIGVLFLTALQSTLFSPAKYGILPEILEPANLPRGNGILELTTFLAILLGGLVCAVSYAAIAEMLWIGGLVTALLAAVGLLASLGIREVPAARAGARLAWNPFPEIAACAGRILGSRELRLTAGGVAYFWGLGVLVPLLVMFYTNTELVESGDLFESRVASVDDEQLLAGIQTAALALGIGLGSFLAGFLSRHKPEIGLVPIGALGMGVFASLLVFSGAGVWWAVSCLALLGISGGFFLVPLNVYLQQEAPEAEKGRILAGVNLLANASMLVALGVLWLLMQQVGLRAPFVYMVIGAVTIIATVFVFSIVPEAFFRFVFWFVTNIVYRIDVVGRENLPLKGPALLVSNHVSFVDGNLILASTHRSIRFIVYRGIAELPGLSWLARTMRVISISNDDGPRNIIKSLREASAALENGELVCIFAEGEISRTGQLLPFRSGVEKILKGTSAPVVPVFLDRVWGSIFSFERGRFFWKIPRRIPYPVSVRFGKPLPADAPVSEVRQAVQELGSEAFQARRSSQQPLHENFVRECRRGRRRLAAVDSTGARVSRVRLLAGAIFMARRIREAAADEERIGILIPPSVGSAVVNLAASMLGRPVVNFNYTAGSEAMRSAAEQCGITKVFTSKKFLENYPVDVPGEAVFLEDLRERGGRGERLLALVSAWCFPSGLLRRLIGARPTTVDDVVTVIFSSGSTGEPKGVELTHFNILSNVQSLSQVYTITARDIILGVLPFFHSTGYTGALWTPLVTGMGVAYHPNPLDARTVGYLARTYGVTMMIATPTFLQNYTRRCEAGDFGSLRYVAVGAEKLKPAVREAFAEKFGIEPLEAYGTTECSPLVTVNVPDFRGRGIRQVGKKSTGIGHPLPGVSVRVVDPETHEPRSVGEEGLLLVKGPNVMRGYLDKPELTAEVLRDGWYVTGDVAVIDDDGFVTLTDRLSRFAKISGEMVPNLKVEQALHDLLGASEQRLVVTAIPDEKKGERLAVIHVLDEAELAKLLERLPEAELPNLWVPRKDAFVRVDEIPVLGTGKVDLRRVKELALEGLKAEA